MRFAVIGGTGLIGERVVRALDAAGHEAVAASRRTGVNSYTGEGLAEALDGADTLVDVTNYSYVDERGSIEFFYVSTLNLLTYAAAAGIRHHVALSVVGTERLAHHEGGYFRAKVEQEALIRESAHPHSIVHATQFYEYLGDIADRATQGDVVTLSHAYVQPMSADDVAASVVEVALGEPINGVREFAGPERFRLQDLVARHLAWRDDPREVTADPLARYLGTALGEHDLLPGEDATLVSTGFDAWLTQGRPAG